MTDLADQEQVQEPEQQPAGKAKKPRRSHNNGLWFGIIFLIVASLGGAGYYLFSQLRDRQENLGGEVKGELNKQIADYQKQLTAIQAQIAALESNIASKDTHFTKTLADFSKLHEQELETVRKELSESIVQLQRQLGKTRGDWLVADAEYLLSAANERLQLIGDVNTSKAALEAADQRLRESGDAATFKVREQIAQEIALLNSVSTPDIVGLYAKVESLEQQVDKLELLLPYTGKARSEASENKPAEKEESRGLLDSAVEKLEDLVTVRRTDRVINEILTPEEVQFIREQLRVKLEMVKIALVQSNETLFQTSTQDTIDWFSEHFRENDDSQRFLAQLQQMSSTKIRSHYPDISRSLKMLRDIAKLRIETDKALDTAPTSENPLNMPQVAPEQPEAAKPASQ